MELREILQVLNKQKWVIFGIMLFTFIFSIILSFLQPPVYETKVLLVIKRDPFASVLSSFVNNKKEGENKSLEDTDTGIKAFSSFLKSREYKNIFYKHYYERYDKVTNKKSPDKMFFYARTAEQEASETKKLLLDTVVFDLGFQSNRAKTSKQMGQLFTDTIRDDYAEKIKNEQQELNKIVSQQIALLEKKVKKLDSLISPGLKKFKYIDLYTYIKDQEAFLVRITLEQSSSVEDIYGNPVILKLNDRIAELQRGIKLEKNGTKRKELQALLKETQQKLRVTEYLVRSTHKSNNRFVSTYVQELNKIRNELAYLKRNDQNITIKIESYKQAVEQLDKLLTIKNQLEVKRLLSNIFIEEIKGPKFNPTPVNKRPKRTIYLSLVLGLLLGFVTAIINQYFSPLPLNKLDLEKSNCLFWRVVPIRSKNQNPGQKFNLSEDYEKYALARTELLHDLKTGHKTFAVFDLTGDGYREAIPKLAAALANIGYSTAIIDANFRNGISLNHSAEGLKDILQGKLPVTDIDRLMVQSETFPNVSMLLSGGKADSPTDLLAGGNWDTTLKYLEDDQHYLFLMGPNNFDLADPYLLARSADLVLFIADQDLLDKNIFLSTLEKINKFNKKTALVFYRNI